MVHAEHRPTHAHGDGVAQSPWRPPDGGLPGHGPRARRVGHGVVDILVPDHVDEPDERHARRGGRRHRLERGQVVGHEGRLQKEVLGRVPGDGELGKRGHIGAFCLDTGQDAR